MKASSAVGRREPPSARQDPGRDGRRAHGGWRFRARPPARHRKRQRGVSPAALATIAPGSLVQNDGWNDYLGLGAAGYVRLPCNLPHGSDVDAWLPWSHIVLSNFQRWTLDVFHGVSPRHMHTYPDQFCYRLDRRDKREDLFRSALNRCLLHTSPAPYSLLTDR